MPDTVGVPLMVIVLFAHDAVTPAGKLVSVPIQVTPVVVWVILVNGVLIHGVGVLDAAFTPFTVIVPVAFAVEQPPDKPIE